MFGAADSVWLASGSKRYPFDDMALERDMHALQARLDDATFASAVAEGRALTTSQAIARASGEI